MDDSQDAGFWGIQITPQHKYSQIVERPFRLTMAALYADELENVKATRVMVEYKDTSYLLCTLTKNILQQQLDICFNAGEHIAFYLKGSEKVHLTGHSVDSDIEVLENVREENNADSDEQSHISVCNLNSGSEEDDKFRGNDSKSTSSLGNVNYFSMKRSMREVTDEDQEDHKGSSKNRANSKKLKRSDASKKNFQTIIEDIKVGKGAVATNGKMVYVYYTGKLRDDDKVFDSLVSGKPLKFKLGSGAVIQGWENGLVGMRVGGKRRLIVPPSEAYGSKGKGPIPPNSVLLFDIELKSVA